MNKLKELWSYPVFRWCVYQTLLLVFGFMSQLGSFDDYDGGYSKTPWKFGEARLEEFQLLFWVLILTVPAVWVWRKPLISWLNKKAEED